MRAFEWAVHLKACRAWSKESKFASMAPGSQQSFCARMFDSQMFMRLEAELERENEVDTASFEICLNRLNILFMAQYPRHIRVIQWLNSKKNKGELESDFFNRSQVLATSADLFNVTGENLLVYHALAQMDEKVRNKVFEKFKDIATVVPDPNAFVEEVRNVENMMRLNSQLTGGTQVVASVSSIQLSKEPADPADPSKTTGLTKAQKNKLKKDKKKAVKAKATSVSSPQDLSRMQYFSCAGMGHRSSACPKVPASLFCSVCNITGHETKICKKTPGGIKARVLSK